MRCMRAATGSQSSRAEAILNTWFAGKTSKRDLLATVPQTDTGVLVEYTKVYE